jgi:hypothetical protein
MSVIREHERLVPAVLGQNEASIGRYLFLELRGFLRAFGRVASCI